MQRIFRLITLTDHRMQSRQTLLFAVAVVNLMLWVMLAVELVIDLQSLHAPILWVGMAAAALIALFAYYKGNHLIVSNGLVILIYGITEAHMITNPKIFTTIVYWLPFVPLVALVTQGLKSARWWILIVLFTHFFNGWYLYQAHGKSYDLQVSTYSYVISGVIFFLVFLSGWFLLYKLLGDAYTAAERKNQELETLKNEIADSKKQLEYYQSQLISLTRNPSLFEWDTDVFYAHVCEIAGHALGVSRVSVWHLEDNYQKLVCQYLLRRGEEKTYESAILLREDSEPYFAALLTMPYIAAADAQTNEATACFTETYLKPLDIYSMLDCPILAEGKPIGVICCEQQKSRKEWQTQDILFLQSLADLIALHYKNKRIKHLLQEIRHQNLELVAKSNEVETMNEELNALNEELQTINETLEQRVEERTHQLEIQNQQLREYAFINSHVLRAPLARIRGLLYLMTHDPNATNDWELIRILIAEANELDAITTKISDILYDGSNLTREDILRMLENKESASKDIEIE
ncbi:GAF domain-containing protein [Rhodoflexus caldus]|uniref:GAF domain-containing protein n=1 Tax=Rhodoflexus caldus TaxID=2891236 RepID=UPI00202A05BF|nr:GAF domain-containing protein [Rhodoflexus caldus]